VFVLALELGLFWKLADEPSSMEELARDLDIPPNRCRYWLDLLVDLELLRKEGNTYSVSEAASTAVLSSLSRNAWCDLASQSRESFRKLTHLPAVIHEPGSALAALGIEHRTYLEELKDDPEKARRFTHMLLDIHQPLARIVAEVLTMDGGQRLMDLGGGSGVMSNAILSRNPGVVSTVVDLENVRNVGKEITKGFPTADRISHHAADFMTDDLPKGFDVVLECDVCVYEEELFRKLQNCLNPGGRLVIVDQFAPEPGVVPPGRPLAWGFLGSLEDPNFTFAAFAEVRETLARTGFRFRDETELPGHWVMSDASLPGG
jgi:cyclopropane fatty-acyl-phospholipid synthase-like methyltransferase